MTSLKKIVTAIAVCLLANGFSVYARAENSVGTSVHGGKENPIDSSATDMKFIYPLKVPVSLSGDYGELRSNHFHGGIDFRIGGVSGAEVMAAADGYVSRITVSGSGYGNGLYAPSRFNPIEMVAMKMMNMSTTHARYMQAFKGFSCVC